MTLIVILPEDQCLQNEFTIGKRSVKIEFRLLDSDVFTDDRVGGGDLGEDNLSVGDHFYMFVFLLNKSREERKENENCLLRRFIPLPFLKPTDSEFEIIG
jgi:hypothetical protein